MNLTALPVRRPRTRAEMVAFLRDHFRYDTMNSWNRSTSYAVQIKVSQLNLQSEDTDACYEMLAVEDARSASGYSEVLRDFGRRHKDEWQTGTRGSRGGYLVLCQGGRRPSGVKSRCIKCGGLNYQPVGDTPRDCGYCHAKGALRNFEIEEVFIYQGKATDADAVFEDWSLYDLRERVKLVWDFDQTCEKACRCFLAYAQQYRVVKKTIRVSQRIHVAVPR
jgi:hypothetical protein